MEQCCPSCGERYEGKSGPGGRLPVIFPCLCRFCKACALNAEVEAQQQHGKGKGKGKGKKKKKGDKQKPTPCLNCKTPCAIPVSNLLLDEALLNDIASAVGGKAAPVCDVCDEEEATKHCGDCKKNQFFCDHCFTSAHRSEKNKGHTPTSIQDHLASSASASGGASDAPTMMCSIHTDEVLKFFCDDCQMLVCATCAVLQHNGHTLKLIGGAVHQHRDEIQASTAATKFSQQALSDTIKALYILKGKIEGNMDAAIAAIEEGYNRVMRAAVSHKNLLKKQVKEVCKEKTDAVGAQITKLEGGEERAANAVKLAEVTLQMATPEQVLRIKQLFVNGLSRLTDHGLGMEQCRAATIEVKATAMLEKAVAQVPMLMQLNVGNTNPAASIAFGEGVETAHAGTRMVAEFVVTAIEFGTGKQSTAGGDDVAVRVAPKDKGGGGSGGGGGAAAAAAPAKGGKRKRGNSGGGAATAFKKSKTGAAASSATGSSGGDFQAISGAAVDNGDGTYNCSYTLPDGAEEQDWELDVLLNGERVLGSPFALHVEAAVTSLGGVEIKGAAGVFGARVNGIYEKVQEMQNGKPVYIKVGTTGMMCCWYAPNGRWTVTITSDKDANKSAGFAHSIAAGLAAPELATQWDVSLRGKWKVQPAVTVAILSGAEVHAAKVAADAVAAAAVAASGFTIAGATGDYARFVNGAFRKTGAMQNGKPVYSKYGEEKRCFCGPNGRWYVTDTEDKDANKNVGWAASIEVGLAAPQLGKAWRVSVNGAYVLQPAVKLTAFVLQPAVKLTNT
eukprot:gene18938-biopygen5531